MWWHDTQQQPANFGRSHSGQRLRFEYPVHNRFGLPLEYRWRDIVVTSLRDVRRQPLECETFIRDPLRRRGSILISGVDQDSGESRSFWLEAMRIAGHRFSRPHFRFALVDTENTDDSAEVVGEPYRMSPVSALVLAETGKILERELSRDLPRFRLVITADY